MAKENFINRMIDGMSKAGQGGVDAGAKAGTKVAKGYKGVKKASGKTASFLKKMF